MPLNLPEQGKFDDCKQKLITCVNPTDILPFLTDVFTPQDIQMLTQKTKKFGNPFGMMDLLYTYEYKARNLDSLFNALKQAKCAVGEIFENEPASAKQTEKNPNIEAKELESFGVSELKEQMKIMEEKLAQFKETASCDASTIAREQTTLELQIGDLQFPSKSILLVGGVTTYFRSTIPDNEVYCTEHESQSRDLHIYSKFPRNRHVGCKIGSIIVKSGGRDKDEKILKSTEFFDIPTGRWKDGPDMICGRRNAMSAVIEDTFFVFGGKIGSDSNSSLLTSAEKLQLSSPHWQAIKDLPNPFYGNAIAVKDQIHIMGAEIQQQQDSRRSALIYIPATDQYITTNLMNDVRYYKFASALLDSNTIVVAGGRGRGITLNSCEMIDIRTDQWMPLSEMEYPRECHQLVNVDDKLYAIGGYNWNCFSHLYEVEVFDIRNSKWMELPFLKHSRSCFTAFDL